MMGEAGPLSPSGTPPDFQAVPFVVPRAKFVVAIQMDEPDRSRVPTGDRDRATLHANPTDAPVF